MASVYVTDEIPQIALDILRKNGFRVRTNTSERTLSEDQLKEVFTKYEAVLTSINDKINEGVINSASSDLRIIANFAVGFDNIDVMAAKKKGIVVTNTPGAAGEAVAEHTFALILACSKKLLEADKFVRQGKYQKWDPMAFLSPQLWGKNIGIIGLGRIGTFVGHMAYGGFKMNILYHDLERAEDFELLTEAKFVGLGTLLKNADVVTVHVPLLPSTRHLIGKDELKIMKNTAILINTSRGPVVEEESLIWALENAEIAAAGLDVFEYEPKVPHTLAILPNVVLTPHSASATFECRDAMAKIAAQNIIDVFEGRTPFGLVKVS